MQKLTILASWLIMILFAWSALAGPIEEAVEAFSRRTACICITDCCIARVPIVMPC